MKSVELVNGFECSGTSARAIQGLSSCGRFTGVRLRAILKQLGVHAKAREVVFFGFDRGPLDIAFRQRAYALNGDPLTRNQGFPVRLIMPDWYGVRRASGSGIRAERRHAFEISRSPD
jgi:DMSO/TMAO reductase YedYZ molybdopterin-dependent catalytic subunit